MVASWSRVGYRVSCFCRVVLELFEFLRRVLGFVSRLVLISFVGCCVFGVLCLLVCMLLIVLRGPSVWVRWGFGHVFSMYLSFGMGAP